MQKNTNLCVDLKTILQEDVLLNEGQCYRGCLTRDAEDHFLFEEEAHATGHRHKRNPKVVTIRLPTSIVGIEPEAFAR